MVIVQFIFPSFTGSYPIKDLPRKLLEQFKYQLSNLGCFTTRITSPNVFRSLLWNTYWWFQPIWKNIRQIGSSCQAGVKNEQCLKPTPCDNHFCPFGLRMLPFDFHHSPWWMRSFPPERQATCAPQPVSWWLEPLFWTHAFWVTRFFCIWGAVRTTFSPKKFRISTVWQPWIVSKVISCELMQVGYSWI